MDPKKTGAFIAALRKELGLTQKDLAQRLHVSDKAISRWETGKGFPETGMLKPLSDLLGVSVGELLGGERMAQEQVKEQADQVIVQSLKKSDRSMSALAGVAILAGVFLIPLIVILLVMIRSLISLLLWKWSTAVKHDCCMNWAMTMWNLISFTRSLLTGSIRMVMNTIYRMARSAMCSLMFPDILRNRSCRSCTAARRGVLFLAL